MLTNTQAFPASTKKRLLALFLAIILTISVGITIQLFDPNPVQASRPTGGTVQRIDVANPGTGVAGVYGFSNEIITILGNPLNSYIELSGTTSINTVVVAPTDTNQVVYMVLNNLNLSTATSPITIGDGATVLLDLQTDSKNNLTATEGFVPAIHVEGGQVVIVGDGSTQQKTGSLTVTADSGAAGIGGKSSQDKNATIMISDGAIVTATGKAGGAGIGSGANAQAGCTTTVIISGGAVTATGSANQASAGAGIGAGSGLTETATINVTIDGDDTVINATGSGSTGTTPANTVAAAGIGAASGSLGTINLNLKGGSIMAFGGVGGANSTAFADAIGESSAGTAKVTLSIADAANVLAFAKHPDQKAILSSFSGAPLVDAILPQGLVGKQLSGYLTVGGEEVFDTTLSTKYEDYRNVSFTTGGNEGALLLEAYTPAGDDTTTDPEVFHGWLTETQDITLPIVSSKTARTFMHLALTDGIDDKDSLKISTAQGEEITANTATVKGDPQIHPGLSGKLGYFHLYNTTRVDGTPQALAFDVVGGNPLTTFTNQLTTLTPDTTYQAFLFAEGPRNRRGKEVGDLEFTTTDAANTVSVTFDPNGGSWNPTTTNPVVTVDRGQAVTMPGSLTPPAGKQFDGWFDAQDNLVTFPLTTNDQTPATMTVTAKWSDAPSSTVTVTFDSNGGSWNPTTTNPVVTVDRGQAVTVPGTLTPPAGKQFDGWFDAQDNLVTFPLATTAQTSATMTVTAKWSDAPSSTVTVTFDPNGGSWNPTTTNPVVTVDRGQAVTVPGTLTPPAGKQFDGWFDAQNNLVTFPLATTAQTPATMTVTAKWSDRGSVAGPHTVIWNPNGGQWPDGSTGNQTLTDVPHQTNLSTPAASSNPSRKNFRFVGWFTEPQGNTPWNFDVDVVTRDLTLYARFAPEEVRFLDRDGQTLYLEKATDGSGRLQRPADPTVPPHRRFKGWFTGPMAQELAEPGAQGEGTVFGTFADAPAREWTFETDIAFEGLILYAHDEWILHAVQFNPNLGSWEDGTTASKHLSVRDGSLAVAPGTVSRQGFTFTGWYVNGAGLWNPNTPITEPLQLYAGWVQSGGGNPTPPPNSWDPWPPTSPPTVPPISSSSKSPSSTSNSSSSDRGGNSSSSDRGGNSSSSDRGGSNSGSILPDHKNSGSNQGSGGGSVSSRHSSETPKTGDTTLPILLLLLTGLLSAGFLITLRLRRQAQRTDQG